MIFYDVLLALYLSKRGGSPSNLVGQAVVGQAVVGGSASNNKVGTAIVGTSKAD